MKEKVLFGIILFTLVLLVNNNFKPDKVDAGGITLGQYEKKLNEFKEQARRNKAAINKTQSEIQNANNRVNSLKDETLKLVNEIKSLNKEIEDFKEKINKKITESKYIIEYMQMMEKDNLYFSYVLKANNMADIIDREMVVKQIIDYNKKSISEMKTIIAGNQERQKKIDIRQKEIDSKEEELKKNISFLGERKSSLTEGGVSIDKQIKIYDELVASYKKLGCKTHHVIGVDCARSDSGVFRRPTQTGYVTQEQYYGYYYTHRGIDISSRNQTREKIYPIADGRIIAKYIDLWGALVIAIEHYSVVQGKFYTSLYAHMSSYAPGLAVGDRITSNQYLGYMGSTGKASGVHLHMEVFPCRFLGWGDPNCSTWEDYFAFAKRSLKSGYNVRKLIAFPKGLYNSWNSR